MLITCALLATACGERSEPVGAAAELYPLTVTTEDRPLTIRAPARRIVVLDGGAEAILEVRGERLAGWGRARRNPADPSVPQIGEELACARALSELAHNLLDAATREIESHEGHRVRVHL